MESTIACLDPNSCGNHMVHLFTSSGTESLSRWKSRGICLVDRAPAFQGDGPKVPLGATAPSKTCLRQNANEKPPTSNDALDASRPHLSLSNQSTVSFVCQVKRPMRPL